MKDKGNYVSVAGKISAWSYSRIQKIMAKKGLNIYQMIQNFCDVIIRYMDDRHNLTPDIEKLINSFEHMIGWGKNFTLTDNTAKPEIVEAIYFMSAKDKTGVRVVDVERPFFSRWKQTFNVQDILDRFLSLTFPHLHRRLQAIAIARDCGTILELLTDIVAEMEAEDDKRELLQPFEDANRSDFGKKPHEGEPYKRRRNKSVETLEFNFTAHQNETKQDNENE